MSNPGIAERGKKLAIFSGIGLIVSAIMMWGIGMILSVILIGIPIMIAGMFLFGITVVTTPAGLIIWFIFRDTDGTGETKYYPDLAKKGKILTIAGLFMDVAFVIIGIVGLVLSMVMIGIPLVMIANIGLMVSGVVLDVGIILWFVCRDDKSSVSPV